MHYECYEFQILYSYYKLIQHSEFFSTLVEEVCQAVEHMLQNKILEALVTLLAMLCIVGVILSKCLIVVYY